MDIEDLLAANSHRDAVVFSKGAEALSWLMINDPEFAIVDPRLFDGVCSAVARLLAQRGTPFIVYSGETDSLIVEERAFLAGERVSKPASPEDIMAAIRRAVGSE